MPKRFAPQLAWLQRRLSPGGYLGLELTLGVLVFVAAGWIFAGIAEDVVTDDPLTRVDAQLAAWFNTHRPEWLTAFALGVSRLHSWPVASLVTALLLGYLAGRRRWNWMVLSVLAIPGGALLNVALKLAFHRARPALSDLAATLQGYSFPSGHVSGAVLFYGVLVLYAASVVRSWRWRLTALLSALAMVILVAFSRVALTVHYLSDVLAAAACSVAWLALCHAAVGAWWARRALR